MTRLRAPVCSAIETWRSSRPAAHASSSGGGAAGATATATATQAFADAMLSELEAVAAAGRRFSEGAFAAMLGRQFELATAHPTAGIGEPHLPLADPARAFGRAAALLAPSLPSFVAECAATVLVFLLTQSPVRVAQAAACADALLPALVRDCARGGQSREALELLIAGDPALAQRAQSLGSGGGGSGGGDDLGDGASSGHGSESADAPSSGPAAAPRRQPISAACGIVCGARASEPPLLCVRSRGRGWRQRRRRAADAVRRRMQGHGA